MLKNEYDCPNRILIINFFYFSMITKTDGILNVLIGNEKSLTTKTDKRDFL